MKNIKTIIARHSLYFAWIISILSTAGSIYFSDILNLAPCLLCWYQRILMFPLIIVIAVAIGRKEPRPDLYVLPFSIGGMGVALYHYLIQYGIIPEKLAPCAFGISCATKTWELFHFITIPLLSFCAFTLITIFIFINKKHHAVRI